MGSAVFRRLPLGRPDESYESYRMDLIRSKAPLVGLTSGFPSGSFADQGVALDILYLGGKRFPPRLCYLLFHWAAQTTPRSYQMITLQG